jgi:hypothetical protein
MEKWFNLAHIISRKDQREKNSKLKGNGLEIF